MSRYTDVTECIKFLVGHTNTYYTTDEGYIKTIANDDPVQIKNNNGKVSDLIVFQEVIKDPTAMILNPFAEGIGKSNDQDWLFQSIITAFTFKCIETANIIVRLLQHQKDGMELDTNVVKLISPYVKLVDDQTIGEIKKITVNYADFMSLYYKRTAKTAVFRCGVFEGPSFRNKFLKVRAKTWTYLEKLYCHLFDLNEKSTDDEKLTKYQHKSLVLGYPRLDSKLRVLYALYEVTNPTFEIIDELSEDLSGSGRFVFTTDISTFGMYIANLDTYYAVAKSAIQPTSISISKPIQGQSRLGEFTSRLPNTVSSGGMPRMSGMMSRVPRQTSFGGTNLPSTIQASYQQPVGAMTYGAGYGAGYGEIIVTNGGNQAFNAPRLADVQKLF
jgi:hypothetical protein